MLTIISLLLISIVLIVIFKLTHKYPSRPPKMTIEYNDEKYKAEIDEFTWFSNGGNSWLGVGEIELAKKMDSIYAKQNDELTFKLTYNKGISYVQVIEVMKDKTREQVNITDSTFKVSEEKGEHIYSVFVCWDSTSKSSHSANYVIKVNVI